MRRAIMLVVTGSLLLTLSAGVALAATYSCTDGSCPGTNNNDEITGDAGNQTFRLKAGDDLAFGKAGAGVLYGDGAMTACTAIGAPTYSATRAARATTTSSSVARGTTSFAPTTATHAAPGVAAPGTIRSTSTPRVKGTTSATAKRSSSTSGRRSNTSAAGVLTLGWTERGLAAPVLFYALPISTPEAKTRAPPRITCIADTRKLIAK